MRHLASLFVTVACAFVAGQPAHADETCQSPYLPKVTGQEDYIYVWTLGVPGQGDGSDKLVTVGANPARPDQYGKVISSVSVGGRHEAHHAGFSDDRRYLWAGGLDDSAIFVFDTGSDPARPKLVRTMTDFVEKTGGLVGPHTFYAIPGRMLITALSNAKNWGGKTGFAEFNNDGGFVRTVWLPEDAVSPRPRPGWMSPRPRGRPARRRPRSPWWPGGSRPSASRRR
jgi:selenium-binding protein 1